jgi:hypothetical protein
VSVKLAPGSLLTTADQARLYEEQMGREAAERQRHLSDVAAGRCTCTPAKVRRRWEGMEKPGVRVVHEPGCAKRRAWMDDPA